MFFKWIKLALENFKIIISILILLGVSGVSIYGNVNELNPWVRTAEALEVEEVEKVVETQAPVDLTPEDLSDAMVAHIREYH